MYDFRQLYLICMTIVLHRVWVFWFFIPICPRDDFIFESIEQHVFLRPILCPRVVFMFYSMYDFRYIAPELI